MKSAVSRRAPGFREFARLASLGSCAIALAACSGVDPLSQDIVGAVAATAKPQTPASPPSRTPAAAYSALSPHWGHIRVGLTDYRIQYQADATVRATEYQWSAQHADVVTLDYGDTRSLAQYRSLNSKAKVLRYALDWTVLLPGQETDGAAVSFYHDMQSWYAQHSQYDLERAFLHDGSRCPAGSAPGEACRVVIHIWTQNRWVVNPADAGLRAYQADRLARVTADADGLFLDEHATGDMLDNLSPFKLAEYSDLTSFLHDMVGLVGSIHTALGDKWINLNTNAYTTSWDAQMIAAAGGAHAEALNDAFHPEMEKRWSFVEGVLQSGARLELVPGGSAPTGYGSGNSATPAAREHLFDLASYYMVVTPTPGQLFYNPGLKWDTPFSQQWVRAAEADIGAPSAARRVLQSGKDPAGQGYRVWARDFDRALVVARPVIDWNAQQMGDGTTVSVALPAGEAYLPLQADGTIGAPVDHVDLRASEAAILLKQSRLPAP